MGPSEEPYEVCLPTCSLWSSLGQGWPHRVQLFWAFGWWLPENGAALENKLKHIEHFEFICAKSIRIWQCQTGSG